MTFRDGIFPKKLKFGVVYPIHKGESKLTCSNYRPISILLILSKTLKKLMHKRLFQYLNNLLYYINTNLDFRNINILSMRF